MIPDDLTDACPECPPGLPDASPPIGPPAETPEGRATDHQCACGLAWTALWDGWFVIARLSAPVTGQADRAA